MPILKHQLHTNMENRFIRLKKKGSSLPIELSQVASVLVTETSKQESIRINVSRSLSGKYYAGYIVNWANGRTSVCNERLELDYFDTEEDAILYYLGYFEMYIRYFEEETQSDLRQAINKYSQKQLF